MTARAIRIGIRHGHVHVPLSSGALTNRQRARIEQRVAVENEARAGELHCTRLMRDGVWQVPESERPKGWEMMGGREQ